MKLCKSFKALCKKHFDFLAEDYGFKETIYEENSYGCYLTLSNKTTAVRVSYEVRDGGVNALLYRLVDGAIPSYPIFIKPDIIINCFYLEDVVALKSSSGHFEPILSGGANPNSQALETDLMQYATALRDYAKDILQGDFSCFPELEIVVKQRAQSLK